MKIGKASCTLATAVASTVCAALSMVTLVSVNFLPTAKSALLLACRKRSMLALASAILILPVVMSRAVAARLLMVSAALAGSAVARAEPTAAPLRVEYRAGAGCPTEADFRARVVARLRRPLGEADAANAYVVTIEERDGRFAGRVGVRAADGAASDRDVAGDTCDDVVAALAVVTALVNRRNPIESMILKHPLAEEAGGDEFHSGGRQFATRDDPDWKIIAAWCGVK